MKFFKLLFALVVLVLAVWGAFALFAIMAGIVTALVKWLFILGVVALAGVGAYKLLSKSDDSSPYELTSAEREMQNTERMLAELRRKQLMK